MNWPPHASEAMVNCPASGPVMATPETVASVPPALLKVMGTLG